MYTFITFSNTWQSFGSLTLIPTFVAYQIQTTMSAKKGDAVAVHYTGQKNGNYPGQGGLWRKESRHDV